MDFTLPEHLPGLLADMDAFIEREIAPLQAENMQYFDQRREHARTDWDNDGIPTREWEDLLSEMRRRADKAGWLRYGLPGSLGGRDGTNIDMAVIREHLAHKGLGLHNDLQNESSIVGNFPQVIMMERFGSDEQRAAWSEALITGERSMAFGLTEPLHGSDATWLETDAKRDGDNWIINGSKRFNTGVHRATHDLIFARTSGEPGQAHGHHRFPGSHRHARLPRPLLLVDVQHAHRSWRGRADRCAGTRRCGARRGGPRPGGRADLPAREPHPSGGQQPRRSAVLHRSCRRICRHVEWFSASRCRSNQAVQWPLAELQTEAQMVRLLVQYAAWHLDRDHHMEVSDKVSMANYRANRLVCDAADRAMQIFGGLGYSRHEPFEHIYRHHRRYRITEGAEEIQIRRVAQRLFKFGRK